MKTMTGNKMDENKFEQLLKTTLKPGASAQRDDQAATDRVLKRLAGPLPRQQMAWWRLPAVLLDWEFTPAWPRVAALVTCAILGFTIGMIGLDPQVDTADAALSFASRADFGGGFYDAEPIRGDQR
jgi:hypothetical protein